MRILPRKETGCCRLAVPRRLSATMAVAAVFLFITVSASCSGSNREAPITAERTAQQVPAPSKPPRKSPSNSAAATRPFAVGDSVDLPSGVMGTVGLWLMHPGTYEKDVTYQNVPAGSTAVTVDFCLEKPLFGRERWYAKLAFPGQKLSQGTDNMWLPVDELTLVSKAKPGA